MSASPSEIRSPRMEALARLPVFFALAGKRTVVAGGNAAAAWKIELLAAAGAHVDVFAADPSEEVASAAEAADVTLHRREIADEDFAGAALAIGAFDDESFHPRHRLAVESRPAREVIDAVVDPAPNRQRAHQVGHNRQRRYRHRWHFQLIDDRVQSPQ